MAWGERFVGHVRDLCGDGARLAPADAELVAAIGRRLDEPLRVAIAGRVKAGKSTLLNAIVGEPLAPTDASECTRIVTWYRFGTGYDVFARLRSGPRQPLEFSRAAGSLEIELGDLDVADVAAIEVEWPSARLRDITLIDTPGLGGMDADRVARTRALFDDDTDDPVGQVDAVVYLMRHLHRADAEFLDSFTDRSLTRPSPVNAIAVLSRADEIGAGRLDAMDSARTIAARYAGDERVSTLAATVVAVAGLLAETGRTLREAEVARLAELAGLDADELEWILVSADRFFADDRTTLASDTRRALLARLGMFGLRVTLEGLRTGSVASSDEVARHLVDTSGLDALTGLVDHHFRARSNVLRARSALSNLRAVALGSDGADESRTELLARIQQIESTAHELAELRLTGLLLSGVIPLDDEEREEVDRLVRDGSPAERMGVADGVPAELADEALRRVDRWRRRAAHPLADQTVAEAAEIVARSYEGLYVELTAAG